VAFALHRPHLQSLEHFFEKQELVHFGIRWEVIARLAGAMEDARDDGTLEQGLASEGRDAGSKDPGLMPRTTGGAEEGSSPSLAAAAAAAAAGRGAQAEKEDEMEEDRDNDTDVDDAVAAGAVGEEVVDDLSIAAASLEGIPTPATGAMGMKPLAAALAAPPHMRVVENYHSKEDESSSSDDIDTSEDEKEEAQPARQAKPQAAGGSDDEEDAAGGINQPRTKNEVPFCQQPTCGYILQHEDIVPLALAQGNAEKSVTLFVCFIIVAPSVSLSLLTCCALLQVAPPPKSKPTRPAIEGPIAKLGQVSAVLDGTVVVQAQLGCPALDEDTELCFEDRTTLGVIAELFGPINEPLYILRFESQSDIDPRTAVGLPIFYSTEGFKRVDQAACLIKGSDASNIHDEEPGEDEVISLAVWG